MSSYHKAVTKRFIQAYYVLLSDEVIKKRSMFKLAKRIGLSQPALSKALKGERNVPYESIINFCRHYDISLYWMLLGDGEMFLKK